MEIIQINPENHALYRSALTEKSPEKKRGIIDRIISMEDEKGNLINLKEEAINEYTKVLLEMKFLFYFTLIKAISAGSKRF